MTKAKIGKHAVKWSWLFCCGSCCKASSGWLTNVSRLSSRWDNSVNWQLYALLKPYTPTSTREQVCYSLSRLLEILARPIIIDNFNKEGANGFSLDQMASCYIRYRRKDPESLVLSINSV